MSVILTCIAAFVASVGAVRAVRGERFSKFWGDGRAARWLDALFFVLLVLLGVWVIDDKSRTVQIVWLGCIAAGVMVGVVVKPPKPRGEKKKLTKASG